MMWQQQQHTYYSNKHINWQWHLHCSCSAFSLIGKMEKLFLVFFFLATTIALRKCNFYSKKNSKDIFAQDKCIQVNVEYANKMNIYGVEYILPDKSFLALQKHHVLMYLIIISLYITNLHDLRQIFNNIFSKNIFFKAV